MSAPGGRALLKLLQLVDLGAASQEPGGMCVVWTCACVRVSPCMCVYTASVRSCARVCRCLHPRVCAHMRMEDTYSAHQPPAALTYNYTNHSLPAGSFVWRPAQRLKSSPHAPTLQEKVSAPRRWKFSFFSLFFPETSTAQHFTFEKPHSGQHCKFKGARCGDGTAAANSSFRETSLHH